VLDSGRARARPSLAWRRQARFFGRPCVVRCARERPRFSKPSFIRACPCAKPACVRVCEQVFLARCDATAFNLSMLTSDLWGVIVGYLLFHQSLMWLYFVALAVVVVGIVVYHRAGFASAAPKAPGAGAGASAGAGCGLHGEPLGGRGGHGASPGAGEEGEDVPLTLASCSVNDDVLSLPERPRVSPDRQHLLRPDGSPR
jgi:hypothetical protein